MWNNSPLAHKIREKLPNPTLENKLYNSTNKYKHRIYKGLQYDKRT